MNNINTDQLPSQSILVVIVKMIEEGKTKEKIIDQIYQNEKKLLRTLFIS